MRIAFLPLLFVPVVLLTSCGSVTLAEYQLPSSASSGTAQILRSFASQHGFQPVSQSHSPPQMGRGLGAYAEVAVRDPIVLNGFDRSGRVFVTMGQPGSKKSERFSRYEDTLRNRLRDAFGDRVQFQSRVWTSML
jgi:hypothetical protein